MNLKEPEPLLSLLQLRRPLTCVAGNEVLHQLTSEGNPQQALRVDMSDWDGVTKHAFYGRFSVGGEEDNFRLHVGAFSSRSTVLGDSLKGNDGKMFTTVDKDNDNWSGM